MTKEEIRLQAVGLLFTVAFAAFVAVIFYFSDVLVLGG